MAWIHLVAGLALLEYVFFIYLVGKARGTFGVKAPATTGHEIFERYFRVQMNTLELIVVFLPALALAAQYWDPRWVAAIGALFLIGRAIYLRSYVADPASRSLGYTLSVVPIAVLLIGAGVGVLRALIGF